MAKVNYRVAVLQKKTYFLKSRKYLQFSSSKSMKDAASMQNIIQACNKNGIYTEIILQIQGGRGHWAVYYTSPQSILLTFSYSLFVQTFQQQIMIQRKGNFAYHVWGCSTMHINILAIVMSYSCRSLLQTTPPQKICFNQQEKDVFQFFCSEGSR